MHSKYQPISHSSAGLCEKLCLMSDVTGLECCKPLGAPSIVLSSLGSHNNHLLSWFTSASERVLQLMFVPVMLV